MYDSKNILYITFLNETGVIFFQSNGSIYFYLIRVILFTIIPLFANSFMFSNIDMYQ